MSTATGVEVSLADLQERIAEVVGDRESIVWGDKRSTWRETNTRTRRLGNALLSRGLGVVEQPSGDPVTSHQQHAAVCMRNRPEYLEAVLAAFKVRLIPFNVNYRYTASELRALFVDAQPAVVFFQACYAETVLEALSGLEIRPRLVQVADESNVLLADGAEWYEDLIAEGSPDPVPVKPSPDDGYLIYTGGTTGSPKGVLWRQADAFVAAMGGRREDFTEFTSTDEIIERARHGGQRFLPLPPFMHGGGLWLAFYAITGGHTIVIQPNTQRFDPVSALETIERERIDVLVIAGTAFARPLLDELDRDAYDISSLTTIHTGGTALLPEVKHRLLQKAPQVTIADMFGSSEGGGHMVGVTTATAEPPYGTFAPVMGTTLISEDRTRELAPHDDAVGWVARRGRLPLGYLNHRDLTQVTFPEIQGVRYAVPGDRGRWCCEGKRIEVLGRDSVCVNSGGEKIFVEEVERTLLAHPAVYDVVVGGSPDEVLGECVSAVVQVRDGREVTLEELREFGRTQLASYKLPRRMIRVEQVKRSPAGKADYSWVRQTLRVKPQGEDQ